jgi:hypothetical protein
MTDTSDSFQIAALDKNKQIQVNASKVCKEAMAKVDEGLEMLTGPAEEAARILQESPEDGASLASLVTAYTKVLDIRSKLAAESTKSLVEIQKDLNKCSIEKLKIDAAMRGNLNLNELSADQIRAMIEGAS